MGILADFFVCSAADALLYETFLQEGPLPAERFRRVESGGITSLELEMLWAIAAGEEWEPGPFELEDLGEPGDAWLCRFPEPFVALLAEATEEQVRALAVGWAATEEIASSPEQIAPLVRDLSALARHGRESGRGLYLWGSL